MTRIWFDRVTHKDARALKAWWYANTHTIQRSPTDRRFWAVMRDQ